MLDRVRIPSFRAYTRADVVRRTPIINSLSDAYGYLRFLKIRPWYDWDEFNLHIARLEKKQGERMTRRDARASPC